MLSKLVLHGFSLSFRAPEARNAFDMPISSSKIQPSSASALKSSGQGAMGSLDLLFFK